MAAKKRTPKDKPTPVEVEVYLEQAEIKGKSGEDLFFVEIKGVLKRRILTVTRALPLKKAEEIKEQVEDRLHLYKRPKRRRRARPPAVKNAWQRLVADRDSV